MSGLSRPSLKGGGSPQHRRTRRDRVAGTGLLACGARPDAPCQPPTVPGASPTLTAVPSLSLSFSLARPHPFSLGPVAGSLRGQEGALGGPDPWLTWPPHLTQEQIRSEGLLPPLQPPPTPRPRPPAWSVPHPPWLCPTPCTPLALLLHATSSWCENTRGTTERDQEPWGTGSLTSRTCALGGWPVAPGSGCVLGWRGWCPPCVWGIFVK